MGNELKIGAFKLICDKNSVSIESISENWYMEFGANNPKYALVVAMIEDESMHEALHGQIVMWYHFSNCMPDAQFLSDYIRIYEEFGERISKNME